MKVTAVFDIGKSNKKFFLFDKDFQEVYRDYQQFELLEDEDGYPCDNLPELIKWLRSILGKVMRSQKYEVEAINFSTYGASLVHVGRNGQVLTPLYNYTKPYPEHILDEYYSTYGDPDTISTLTASPASGMLNSGLQLYWIKKTQPDIFDHIQYSLHFPQFVSYLFTGIPVSDFTSLGSHTGFWDYERGQYHHWVYEEGIDRKLAPIVPADTSINQRYLGNRVRIGVGIHDSSAALLPYIRSEKKPFVLISTGTWSISLNPYNDELLTSSELNSDCLCYMQVDGSPVKAARLFLGNEYKNQVKYLLEHFGKERGYDKGIKFDPEMYRNLVSRAEKRFSLISLGEIDTGVDLNGLHSFEEAYHQLMIELMEYQVRSIKLAMGASPVNKIYVDGGFADNDVYVEILGAHFPDQKLRTTASPLGSALGAALVISDVTIGKKFLKKNYYLKKHKPTIFQS